MSYPGLTYPTDANTLNTIKDQGYFVLVDRNADNIALVPGGEINTFLNTYQDWIFVFGMNIVGTRQNIIDALYLLGYDVNQITQIITAGISIDNVNTPEAQQWITIFKQQNIQQNNPQQQIVQPQPDPIYEKMIRKADEQLHNWQASQQIMNTHSLSNIGETSFNVGDVVSYTGKGGIMTGVINKVNPKTYQIGTTRVPHQMVRRATTNEIQTVSPTATTVATKNNFYVGQEVQFEHKGQLYRGQISKLNPAKATIGIYHVPYVSLMAV